MRVIFIISVIVILVSALLLSEVWTRSTSMEHKSVSTQQRATDILCGPRALLIICQMYGVDTNLEELSQLAKVDERGTSMYNLLEAARAKGLSAVGRILTYDQLLNLGKPVIAFVNNNHFSVLEAIDKERARISDDLKYPKVISREELAKMWKGYCLVVSKPKDSNRSAVPNIVFDSVVYDFGMMPQGSFVTDVFILTKKGGVPLKILSVSSACDCLVTAPTKTVIQPDETAKISIRLTLRDKGKVNRTITVSSNDPYCRIFPLTVTGDVVDPIEVVPQSIYLRRISVSETIRRTVRIRAPQNKRLEILKISASDYINIKRFPGPEPDRSAILEVVIGPNLPIGSLSGSIELELKNIYSGEGFKSEPIKIAIPVEGIVEGELSVFPERFFFGFISPKERRSCSVELKNTMKSPISVIKAESKSSWIEVSVVPKKPGYHYEIKATIKPHVPKGILEDVVRIHTKRGNSVDILEIPLFGIVR